MQNGNVIEYTKDNTSVQLMGDFLNPIICTRAMKCIVDIFYTDDDDIWKYIKVGTLADFSDKKYFDIK